MSKIELYLQRPETMSEISRHCYSFSGNQVLKYTLKGDEIKQIVLNTTESTEIIYVLWQEPSKIFMFSLKRSLNHLPTIWSVAFHFRLYNDNV